MKIILFINLLFPILIYAQTPTDMFQCIETYGLKIPTKKVDILKSEWRKENPATRPIFESYPELQGNLPHIDLVELNTPLHKLDNVSADLQANIFIKRDDRVGNKTRKAEFLFADAKQKGANCVFTVGGIASNHAAIIAEYAHKLGMDCKIFLMEQPNSYGVRKKLLADLNNGAEIVFCENTDARSENILNYALNYKKNNTAIPYFITTGGSNKVGTIGYVNAAFELKNQLEMQNLSMPDFGI